MHLADRLRGNWLRPSGDEGSEVPTSLLHEVLRLTLHEALFSTTPGYSGVMLN
jgi:hypothetical protein